MPTPLALRRSRQCRPRHQSAAAVRGVRRGAGLRAGGGPCASGSRPSPIEARRRRKWCVSLPQDAGSRVSCRMWICGPFVQVGGLTSPTHSRDPSQSLVAFFDKGGGHSTGIKTCLFSVCGPPHRVCMRRVYGKPAPERGLRHPSPHRFLERAVYQAA